MSTVAPTVTDWHAKFDGDPAFVGVPDDTIQSYLTEALDFVTASVWGKWYSYGVLYLSAHRLASDIAMRAKGGGAAAGVEPESKSAGGVSISRAQTRAAILSNSYKSTVYGVRFYELMRQVATPVIVT